MSKSTPKKPGSATEAKEAATDPHRLAMIHSRKVALQKCHVRTWRGQWYAWTGTRYAARSDRELRADLTRTIRAEFVRLGPVVPAKNGGAFSILKVRRGLVSDVVQALESLCQIPDATEQPCWINRTGGPVIAVANGLLDIGRLLKGESDVLQPHSAEWFSTVCLPYAYDATARCPRWLAFLDWALQRDVERIAFLQEWPGYCLLLPLPSRHIFVILVGEGANGKSVALAVMTAILGEENVSHVPVELFDQRFQLTQTLGKLLNISPEVSDLSRTAEGLLKAVAGGDRLFFDRKNRDGIDARPSAKLMFSTNELPRFRDRSQGLLRRAVIVPFNAIIAPDQQNPNLTAELTAELPGIFNWVTKGARRLAEQGRFTNPKICREALEQHWEDSNPTRVFLVEETVALATARTPCQDVRCTYRSWCEARGYRPLDEAQFGKELRRYYPTVCRVKGPVTSTGARPYVYEGLALRTLNGLPGLRPAAPLAPARPVVSQVS